MLGGRERPTFASPRGVRDKKGKAKGAADIMAGISRKTVGTRGLALPQKTVRAIAKMVIARDGAGAWEPGSPKAATGPLSYEAEAVGVATRGSGLEGAQALARRDCIERGTR